MRPAQDFPVPPGLFPRALRSAFVFLAVLVASTFTLADDSPAPPAIVPLEPVPLPPPPPLEPVPIPPAPRGELTFGEIEFEMPPEKPARPAPKPPKPAGKEGQFEIVSVEFEMPPEPAGELTFGEITFEIDPKDAAKAEIDRIGKAVKEVLKNQKKASKSIGMKLDELEKKKGKPSAKPKRWHARGIPGGNTEVGTIHSHSEAETATYTAPAKVPGDPVVPVQVHPEGGGNDLSAAAEVTVLDTDAVLEAHWTIEETLSTSLNTNTPGPFGSTVVQNAERRSLIGSGTVRFEDRPMPGLTRAEWEETRAAMVGMTGARSLQAIAAKGSYQLSGGGTFVDLSPGRSSTTQTSVSAVTRAPTLSGTQLTENLVLKSSGKNWEIVEWNTTDWRPGIRITNVGNHKSRSKDSGTTTWATTTIEPVTTVEVYRPTDRPDRNTAPSVTASRSGSLTLSPQSEEHFTGSIRFKYRNETPEDGKSTNVMEREVTWTFDLRIAK
ncbi:MAG: hypothetical protein SFV32_12015 [Opitutaceae bacterium]|nr:hypothetical protein [Opitutaceae bacterium]